MRSVFSPSWNDISFARRKEHFHPTNPTYELPLHCNIGGFLLPVWPIPPICREGDKNFLQKNTYLRRKGKMGQFPTHQFPNDKGQERIRPSHHRTATTQLWERRNNGCYSLILDPGRNYIVDNQQQINHIPTLLASGKQGSILFLSDLLLINNSTQMELLSELLKRSCCPSPIKPPRKASWYPTRGEEKQKRVALTLPHLTLGLSRPPGLSLRLP